MIIPISLLCCYIVGVVGRLCEVSEHGGGRRANRRTTLGLSNLTVFRWSKTQILHTAIASHAGIHYNHTHCHMFLLCPGSVAAIQHPLHVLLYCCRPP